MLNAKAQSRGVAESERRTPNIEHRTPKSFPFSVLRSAFGVLHIPHPFSFLLSPFSFLLSPPSFSPASPRLCVSALKNPRRGATLLVTLGILTVLSVMAVTFLVATRLQQQTAAAKTHRLATRDQLHEALHLAMQTVESAYCYTNFTEVPLSAEETVENIPPQRLAPVGAWFSERWERDANISRDHTFQTRGVLASPLLASNDFAAAWTANLLKPDVLRLIPPALTNALDLDASSARPFRVGWQEIDPPGQDNSAPWKDTGTRVAFAVFDVSGFLDANYFITGPTTQKLPRVCFSQADVTNWVEKLSTLNVQLSTFNSDPDRTPFSSLSYDPNPDADPFIPDSIAANPLLGRASFANSRLRKFDLNSFTNLLDGSGSHSGDWTLSGELMGRWLRPVVSALTRSTANQPLDTPGTFSLLQVASMPWNLLNAMDEDRVPQLSLFAGIDLATRHNAAVEDVPLINKITVFNIFGGNAGSEDPAPPNGRDKSYYEDQLPQDASSNHYAVAVELWYPFAPHTPPPSAALYCGIYTNAADVGNTSTNRPLTGNELRDWFNWNEAATSNTVMQTLFYAWADAYTNAVGPAVWQHPLWQVVTTNADAWFTTNMVNHPSWPVADTNGVIAITNTPIWHAFYPETYEVVTTNQVEFTDTNNVPYLVEIVTTNVYTYANTTNAAVQWVAEPEMTTNRLSGQIGVTDPDPYPVLLWSDPETSRPATNVFLGFIDSAGATNLFFSEGQTNHLQAFYATPPDGIFVVSSNGLSGAVSTNPVSALFVAPWTPDAPLEVSLQTNLVVVTEVEPLPPLPMPPELGATLDALFGMLLSPDLNLDTSDKLFAFLMLRPSEFDLWDYLNGYLAQYPMIQNTLMPVHREADLGNLTERDRIDLTEPDEPRAPGTLISPLQDSDGEEVGEVIEPRENGFGTYWTVYPKRVVSFPEITITTPADPTAGTEEIAVTNYYALGSKSDYRVWMRPVVTINTNGAQERATDRIVDEALLDGDTVRGWNAVTNLYVSDPRHNAYADYWLPNTRYPAGTRPAENRPQVEPFPDWDAVIGTTNLSTEVTEYPFIHLNRPLDSIGEIGHVYASPDRLRLTRMENAEPAHSSSDAETPLHDTISFATRPGAALLDLFTLHAAPSNLPPHQTGVPWRGLVQANTDHPSVVETLFSFGTLGWTNATDTSFLSDLSDSSDLSDWSDAYLDALTNAPPAGIGWRSFADMLPAIATNELLRLSFTPPFAGDAPAHDWIEDAVRHLPDRVSFRQNIFVVVIAAQTLSPVSTASRPVVLADQRAAVTVIRDAFTGRWTIHDWRWLTE